MSRTEEWRDVVGYEGRYKISNFGRVKSLNYNGTRKDRLMRPSFDKDGYLQLLLYKNGKRKNARVHQLVAQAFIQNSYELPEVNHKDENKANNVVDNLEWCSVKYNANYGTRNLRLSKRNGMPVCKIKNGKVVDKFDSISSAARAIGISTSGIWNCCNGNRAECKGYIWRFEKEVSEA